MLNKIFKLFLIIAICSVTFISNIYEVNAVIPPETTCNTIKRIIDQRKKDYEFFEVRLGSDHSVTLAAKKLYEEAVKWQKDNCNKPCPYSKPFDVVSLGNEVDNSPYYLSKFVMKDSGDAAFCIQPDALYKTGCTNYQGGTAYVALALSSQEIFQCLVCFS